MTRSREELKGPPSLGGTIAQARKARTWSIRELGRRAGVSAAQVSRIESGEAKKPAVETLVAVARALDCNPVPLMIVAGHVGAEEARERLRHFMAQDSEFAAEWIAAGDSEELDAMRAVVETTTSTESEIVAVAARVFLTAETEETLWHDAYLSLPTQGEGVEDLRELVAAWPTIDAARRVRVLDFARDQVALSRSDFADLQGQEDELNGGDQ